MSFVGVLTQYFINDSVVSHTLRAIPNAVAALGTKQVARGAVAKARVRSKFLIASAIAVCRYI
jgi:hypothetical protein